MTTTLDRIITTIESTHSGFSSDQVARAIWTIIAEPGDSAAGELINALGAAEALRYVVEGDEAAFEAIDVKTIRERTLPRISTEAIQTAFQKAERSGTILITAEHPHWPKGLNKLGAHAPYALWARGNTTMLTATDGIAVVGARAATGYGEHMTMELTAGLVGKGRTIISGAAYGIDGMAHRAALASDGNTVAILAGGVDRFYPAGHSALLARIAEAGVIVSELSCGQAPTKWRFLMRNRIIAAASASTLVIEAGWRSGSLNTAGHAIALGRPVGAVPGPVTSAASAGCHRLIREFGATLVTTTDEAADL
jgi:DNA protecting protein DprA